MEKKESTKMWPFYLLATLILIICVVCYFLLKDNPERGTFGDMFGSVNALFSGIALAGIIFTIYLQKEELRLQRLELKETRKELKRSAAAQEKSEKALTEQVKSMKVSSELTALNSLLNYYSELKGNNNGILNSYELEASQKVMKYENRITELLEETSSQINRNEN